MRIIPTILLSLLLVSPAVNAGEKEREWGKFLFGFAIGMSVANSQHRERHYVYEDYPSHAPLSHCPIVKKVKDYRNGRLKQYIIRECY